MSQQGLALLFCKCEWIQTCIGRNTARTHPFFSKSITEPHNLRPFQPVTFQLTHDWLPNEKNNGAPVTQPNGILKIQMCLLFRWSICVALYRMSFTDGTFKKPSQSPGSSQNRIKFKSKFGRNSNTSGHWGIGSANRTPATLPNWAASSWLLAKWCISMLSCCMRRKLVQK